MLRNGRFEFDNVKQGTCCCSHSVNDHLDCIDCCLAKTKEIRICEEYHDKESKMTMPQKQGKLPSKEEQKRKQKDIEDCQLDTYIQTLAKI